MAALCFRLVVSCSHFHFTVLLLAEYYLFSSWSFPSPFLLTTLGSQLPEDLLSEPYRLAISLRLLLASNNVLALFSPTAGASIEQGLYESRPTAEILKLLRLRIG